METIIGLIGLVVTLAVIIFVIWRLLPENRENRDPRWVYGREYRVRGTTAPVSLTIASKDIEYLDRLGLLPVDDNEFIISASKPEDIEDIERQISEGRLKLVSRKERNYRVQ
jgi:hypothetical protein